MGAPPITDDPTGGRRLSRRLARWLPAAALAGLLAGIPLAFAAGDWRVAPLLAAAAAAVTGTVLAAVEDGRVQRRIDERREAGGRRAPGRRGGPGAEEGDVSR